MEHVAMAALRSKRSPATPPPGDQGSRWTVSTEIGTSDGAQCSVLSARLQARSILDEIEFMEDAGSGRNSEIEDSGHV